MRERGTAVYQLFLLGLSIYVLVVLVAESLYIRDPEVKLVLQYIDFAICIIFLGDFFVNLYTAKSKLAYLKWGWIDFIASVPALDPLRWGRLSRLIRILRFLRSIKSMRLLLGAVERSKMQSLTLVVLLVSFVTFSLSAALIIEFERPYESELSTASAALWWSTLNVLNAKVPITQAKSPEGILVTLVLNKLGLLIFAYINGMMIAWLVQKKQGTQAAVDSANATDE